MNKSLVFISILTSLLLSGCQTGNIAKGADIPEVKTDAQLTAFNLTAPFDGAIFEKVPTFTWEQSSENAYYKLEISTNETFSREIETDIYYDTDYISTTSFKLNANLSKYDVTYYWRVIAKSGIRTKQCNEVFSFYLKAPDLGEVEFPIGNEDDWSIHQEGIPVDLSIDKNDFFGNGDTLAFTFEKEVSINIGWVVLTRTYELDTYGTDSFLLNIFYAGNDANAYVRLVDNVGGFWRHPIRLSNNAKQTVILEYKDFEHDTKDVSYGDDVFHHYHIRYFEIVLEKSWGDGACVIGGMRSVKRSSYNTLFMKNMDFREYPTSTWTYENNYNFGYDVSSDGSEYTLHYSSGPNDLNPAKINGYGFTKMPINKYFDKGDMIKFSVKYSGNNSGKFSFRIREEDKDLWYYRESFSLLNENEYKTFYVPFEAFAWSSSEGNGKKEFGYIVQFQFGVTDMYGTGSLSYKDIEVVDRTTIEQIDVSPRNVGLDGVVENFDNYTQIAEPFYQWSISSANKDEYISLDKTRKIGASNVQCGKLTYKSDMEAAYYYLNFGKVESGFSGISFDIKDDSLLNDNLVLKYLKSVSAKVQIGVILNDNTVRYHEIMSAPKLWTRFDIPFSALQGAVNPIDSKNIKTFVIALSYFYYLENGAPYPVYTMSNPVYFDNIMFNKTTSTEVSSLSLEKALVPDVDDSTKATIDNFEAYNSSSDIEAVWGYGNTHPNNNIELSSDVSSLGGNKSLKGAYKGINSINYALALTVDPSIKDTLKPKGLSIDIKGVANLKIYINIYYTVGSTLCQVRKTISNIPSTWTRYSIGFEQFVDYQQPSGSIITLAQTTGIYKITIGAVDASEGAVKYFYLDNIALTNTFTRSTYTNVAI